MAGACLIYKTFKLAFQDKSLTCNIGTDVSLSVDTATTATLATIIGQTATVDNVKTCLKYGAPVAAVCVAGKIIHQAWSWITPSSVKAAGELEVAIDPGQNDNLQKLIENGEILQKVKEGFGDLENKLKALLGKEVFDQVGTQVMDLIGGVRVDSVHMSTTSALPENMVAGKIVEGTRKVKESGNKMTVFDRGNCEEKGITAAEYIAKGGVMEGEACNGSALVAKGYDADEAVKLAKCAHGDLIQVRITGEELDHAFEQGFKPMMTIWDVCKELRAQIQPFNKCKVKISRGEVVLHENLTLAQAAMDGSTRNWKAAFEESKQ